MRVQYFLIYSVAALMLMSCDNFSPTDTAVRKHQINPKTGLVIRNLDAAQVMRGEAVYTKNCVGCHGPNGVATPDWRKPNPDGKYPPPPLDSSAHAWHHSTDVLKKTILKGTPPEIGSMPAWEGILTEQQVDDVVVWIKSLWSDELYDIWYKNFEDK